MSDYILVDGDTVLFLPTFGAATVIPKPGKLAGSGPATFLGKKVCVAGDEGKVEVAACDYMTPQYSIPGKGTLKIAALASAQTAQKTQTGGTAMLLLGGKFTAKFEVQVPAKQPPPGMGSPIPDPTPQYSGEGSFVTTNSKYQGT